MGNRAWTAGDVNPGRIPPARSFDDHRGVTNPPPPCIAAVDDDEPARKVRAWLLTAAGLQVWVFGSAEVLLEAAARENPYDGDH